MALRYFKPALAAAILIHVSQAFVSPQPQLSQSGVHLDHSADSGRRSSLTQSFATLEKTELPQKLYFPKQKESPKVLGGLKVGLRKMVVITGASSGLGLSASLALAKTGNYFVIMACRDIEKAKKGTLCLSSVCVDLTSLCFCQLPSRVECQMDRMLL